MTTSNEPESAPADPFCSQVPPSRSRTLLRSFEDYVVKNSRTNTGIQRATLNRSIRLLAALEAFSGGNLTRVAGIRHRQIEAWFLTPHTVPGHAMPAEERYYDVEGR